MTSARQLVTSEPPPPQRGLSLEERGRDISAAQADAEEQESKSKQFTHAMSPHLVWSMAKGYPVVLKQFIQFCLILIYPAWVLFWPVRQFQQKNHPEEYAASQQKK